MKLRDWIWPCMMGIPLSCGALLRNPQIDVNRANIHGIRPLAQAATWGRTAVVRLLLAQDAIEVNLPDDIGDTALACAAKEGHVGAIEALLSHERVHADSRNRLDEPR